jgi:hypothetical protein
MTWSKPSGLLQFAMTLLTTELLDLEVVGPFQRQEQQVTETSQNLYESGLFAALSGHLPAVNHKRRATSGYERVASDLKV